MFSTQALSTGKAATGSLPQCKLRLPAPSAHATNRSLKLESPLERKGVGIPSGLIVRDKPGVLVRVALVFARRGYNIESLVVSPGVKEGFSRMTITSSGDPSTLGQIIKLHAVTGVNLRRSHARDLPHVPLKHRDKVQQHQAQHLSRSKRYIFGFSPPMERRRTGKLLISLLND